MRTFLLSCAVLVLSLAVGSNAMAATSYQYSGNNYTTIIDFTPPNGTTYDTSMSVTGSFSTLAPLAANLALTDISADVTSYSFNDGVATLDESTSIVLGVFSVATDALGDITEWKIELGSGLPIGGTGSPGDQRQLISTVNIAGLVFDRGSLQECAGTSSCVPIFADNGEVHNSPGTWTIVPEPGTASLLSLGLIGLAVRRSAGRRAR